MDLRATLDQALEKLSKQKTIIDGLFNHLSAQRELLNDLPAEATHLLASLTGHASKNVRQPKPVASPASLPKRKNKVTGHVVRAVVKCLTTSDRPLTADEIAKQTGKNRYSVNTVLRTGTNRRLFQKDDSRPQKWVLKNPPPKKADKEPLTAPEPLTIVQPEVVAPPPPPPPPPLPPPVEVTVPVSASNGHVAPEAVMVPEPALMPVPEQLATSVRYRVTGSNGNSKPQIFFLKRLAQDHASKLRQSAGAGTVYVHKQEMRDGVWTTVEKVI